MRNRVRRLSGTCTITRAAKADETGNRTLAHAVACTPPYPADQGTITRWNLSTPYDHYEMFIENTPGVSHGDRLIYEDSSYRIMHNPLAWPNHHQHNGFMALLLIKHK